MVKFPFPFLKKLKMQMKGIFAVLGKWKINEVHKKKSFAVITVTMFFSRISFAFKQWISSSDVEPR